VNSEPLEEDRGSEIVPANLACDFIHALTNADLCREVEHTVDANQCAIEQSGVPYIALQYFDVGRQQRFAVGMDLRDQAIQHSNMTASSEQFHTELSSNEPSSASQKEACRHELVTAC
jgi:hypothetical protein